MPLVKDCVNWTSLHAGGPPTLRVSLAHPADFLTGNASHRRDLREVGWAPASLVFSRGDLNEHRFGHRGELRITDPRLQHQLHDGPQNALQCGEQRVLNL